jgi:signal peptidase I
MVFKYPNDTSLNYIKRVIGVPGDKIVYKDKSLRINGEAIAYTPILSHSNEHKLDYSQQLREEDLLNTKHKILVRTDRPSVFIDSVMAFPKREACSYKSNGFTCTVPSGNYFMMGDNRDNSEDSRYWGFVPDKDLIGKAFMVWMNFNDPRRIGTFLK